MQDELVRSAVHKHGAPSRINRSSQRGSGIGYVPFLRLVKRPGRPVSRVGLIEQVRPQPMRWVHCRPVSHAHLQADSARE
jgi:hypothetical protein